MEVLNEEQTRAAVRELLVTVDPQVEARCSRRAEQPSAPARRAQHHQLVEDRGACSAGSHGPDCVFPQVREKQAWLDEFNQQHSAIYAGKATDSNSAASDADGGEQQRGGDADGAVTPPPPLLLGPARRKGRGEQGAGEEVSITGDLAWAEVAEKKEAGSDGAQSEGDASHEDEEAADNPQSAPAADEKKECKSQ